MSQAISSEVFGCCVLPSCGNGTVSVGKTTTVEPGEDASVKNSGTCQHVILDFEIPRGETGSKGDTGARGPVGLETVSASIPEDDTPGTPSVVPTFGDGTLSLAFSHLKGGTGAAGPQGEKGEKGDQGNSGYSGAAGELEVVNNLNDGGATAALSAEQGKVLYQKVENSNVLDLFKYEILTNERKVLDYTLLDTGKWGTSTSYKHFLIPVASVGEAFIVKQGANYSNYIAFLTSLDLTAGADAPLVSGTSRIQVPQNALMKFDVPDTTQWIYVSYVSGSFELKFYEAVFNTNYAAFNQAGVSELSRMILDTGKWGSSTVPRHRCIPVSPGDKVKVVANILYTHVAWLTSDSNLGEDAPIVPGTTARTLVEAGTEWGGIAPVGARYLYALTYYSDETRKPFAIKIDDSEEAISKLQGLTLENTFQLPMEMGSVDGTTGFPRVNAATTEPATRLRSPNYIKFGENNTFAATNLEADETLYLRYYDGNLAIIGSEQVTGALTIPSGTAYIKCLITKETEFTHTHPLIITSNLGEIVERKNGEERDKNANIGCVFEVQRMPTVPQDIPGTATTFQGSTQRIWDRGYLQLPTDYRSTGKGSPLILFCHGTNGFDFSNGTHLYDDLLKFYTHNGYVVADCDGQTAYYGTNLYSNQASTIDCKMNPLLTSCYASFVDWLCRDYNIDPDRIYLLSKSAGGLVATWLGYYAPFKVRAIANLAPALSMAGQSWRVTSVDSLNFWLARLGLTGHTVSAYLEGTGDMDFVLANTDKIIGWDPLFMGTDTDYDDILTEMYGTAKKGSGTQSQRVWRGYANNSTLMGMLDSLKKYQPVPMKIWVAEDDDVIPYDTCEKYQEMVRRGNGICYIRTMPTGTGGHHSVDTSASAPTVSYACKDGTTMTTPVAYAEALDWFEQW